MVNEQASSLVLWESRNFEIQGAHVSMHMMM